MALDIQVLAKRLKHSREIQAIETEVVSQATGIACDRLNSIESGVAIPTGDEVLILANYYHCDFRDFLDHTRPEPFAQTEILYRRHGNDFLSKDRQAIQEFLYLCEIEAFLEAELNIQKQKFSFTPKGSFYKAHGERAANELRSFLNYPPNAIPHDVFEDFRKIGFHVFRRRLANSNISGLYIDHPIAGHCVLVNYEEDIYRQRFSVSHEAAHAIFDSSDSVIVSYKTGNSKYGDDDLKEIRANRFASCYLIPPDQLPKGQQWSEELAVSWAQRLRVSTTTLSISLKEARLINGDIARWIRSVRVPAQEKIDPEAPDSLTDKQKLRRLQLMERGLSDYYASLCFEAYHRGIISAGKLSETLLSDHAETREISILFGRSIHYGD